MLSSSRPPRGGDRPGTSARSVGPSGRPLEERDGFLVSGPRSSAEVKMGWEELGSNRRKKGRKRRAAKKELNSQIFTEPVGLP